MGTYTLTEGDDLQGIDPYRYPTNDPGPYTVFGLGGNDGISGGNLNDTLYGGEGNDSLAGAAGANAVYGGNGNDYIQFYNESGSPPFGLTFQNYDLLGDQGFGEAGDDTIQFILGGASVAHAGDGGAGFDTIAISFETRYGTDNQPVIYNRTIDLTNVWTGGVGTVDTGTITNVERITGISGGEGNDTIILGNYVAAINPANGLPFDAPLINGGKGNDYISGGSSRDQISGGGGNDTIFGNDGDDYISAGGAFQPAGTDNIHGGNGDDGIFIFSGTASFAYGDDGNDSLYGMAADGTGTSTFDGGAGNDNISINGGYLSRDILIGGTGNDILSAGDGNDDLYGGSGDDSLDGSDGDDIAFGGDGNDFFYPRDGNDTSYGGLGIDTIGGGAGTDTLYGDGGDDILQGGNGADTSHGGDGNDLLDETVQDDASNDVLLGDAGNDTLKGGDGNDVLVGGIGDDIHEGGNGNDEMIGSTGNDAYNAVTSADSVIELAGEGTDTVTTSAAVFTLSSNVEILTYTGGAAAFLGLGNASDNVITGGAGRDELYGRDGNDILNNGGGGVGNEDTMLGGLGNDTYNISVAGSSTIELSGQGTDTVRTTFSIYGLQANIENLTFTDNANHAAGVGNILDNILTGGTGVDDLFGREGNDHLYGGTGSANTLLGQEGDDIYHVDAVGDSVVEFAGQGFDRVQTALASYTMSANVELLEYTGFGTFTGIGNAGDNLVYGGGLVDFLSGLDGNDKLIGGNGADTMLGGTGADQFLYVGSETGLDRILDFTSGQDKIALSPTGFAHTATVAFVQSGTPLATNTNSTFLYNVNNGIVSYDADGTGAGAAVQIAQLNAGLTLAGSDFIFG
jgi:Ca2+-binding RTX toxin-like protein